MDLSGIIEAMDSVRVRSPVDTISSDLRNTPNPDQIHLPDNVLQDNSTSSSHPVTPLSGTSTAPTDISQGVNTSSEVNGSNTASPPLLPVFSSSDFQDMPNLMLPLVFSESFQTPKERQGRLSQGNDRSSCPNSPTFQSSSDNLSLSQSCPSSPQSGPTNPDATTSQATHQSPRDDRPFNFMPSTASQEWTRRKVLDDETNDVLDELMRYEGLEEVKQQFLDIKSKVDVCKEQGRDLKSERFNIVFQGNPGTGKTTFARLYAEFLCSLGILESDCVKETTGIKIATKGTAAIKRNIKGMLRGYRNDRSGGVLFVDEAYQLTAPYADSVGRAALDIILTMMENNVGKLVVVFVGYKDEMESFFEHNPGLSSRIPYTMNFADFTDGELWKILSDNIASEYGGNMKVEGGMNGLYMRIAIRRLAQNRGSRSFGNARAVQNLLSKIAHRQAQRLARERKYGGKPDIFLFTKEDLIGPDPATASTSSEAWIELQRLVGLNQVKECVRSMIKTIQHNYLRELAERPPLKFSLNQLFVGNPGTGKTTVAKLYGRILADLGYLSNGDVILKNPADFIGDCLGKSEAKTRKILDATVGKILVIDEAYMLDAGDPGREQDKFKTGVIDTLVSMVQGVPGEDRCIILIGYEDKIKDMFQNVNPGLSRRFPIERPFRFENFDISQLEQILRLKMGQQGLSATDHAIKVALEVLERSLMRPNFTNAGEIDSLLSMAKTNYEMRLSAMPIISLDADIEMEAADFDPDHDRGSRVDCRKLMEGLVHSTITDKFVGYQKRCFGARKHGLNPREQVPTSFIFKGPSGTGKTVTAQKMGELFYNMGLLATPQVVECTVADLLGQYVGQTVPKTRKKLQEGVGRVLFIDEAHRLVQGQYATEAVDELIQFLTRPSHKGKMIVILAGYTADMHKLISSRPALASLFPEEITFDNIPLDDCIALLAKELEFSKFTSEAGFLTNPSSPDYGKVKRLFRAMQSIPSWSNARDVRNLSRRILGGFLESIDYDCTHQARVISAAHITSCMWQMITQQKDRCAATASNDKTASPQQPPTRGMDSHPMMFNPQPTPPPVASTSYAPRAESSFSTANNSASVRTQGQGLNSFLSSQATAVHTGTNGPQSNRSTQGQNAPSADIREEGVSDAVWQELSKAKKIESARRALRNTEIKRLERSLRDAEKSGDASACDALRSQLSATQQRIRDEERVQQAIQQMNVCVNGFSWNKVAGGYRCEGGMHFVTDEDVQSRLI
ncbi:P-loop containing nucleoside triphosphate hydrolase protein [Daldinia loculata]|nr:P-loop containing nucleoside triphosphate hydrolase protein [Daldinia loculata]